jgi:outer membrane protein assembly factor BamB/tRNA A-37 threonylcarbamoyl transferase component Bud32
MRKKSIIVFALLLLVLLLPLPVSSEGEQASDSSQFHGDERHAGYIATVGPTSPLLAWKINQGCDGMIASGGRLVVAQSGGDIYVLNETNAKYLLKDTTYQGFRSRYPVIGAGTLFYTKWDTIIVKNLFSLADKLSVGTGTGFSDRYSIRVGRNEYLLAYSNAKLFIAYTNYWGAYTGAVLRVLIASNGALLWMVKFDDYNSYAIGTIPTVADDVVVIGFLKSPKITAISTDNGKILWNFTLDSPIASDSIAYSTNFYFGSSNGVVYAVSKDGREIWHTRLGGGIETTPAVAFGKVYVGADDGNLYALNASNGKLLWKYTTGGPIVASPVVSLNGLVYVGSTDGRIYALDAKNGELVWSDNTGASIEVTPVLDNGMLFVCSSDGTIRAYGRPSPSSNLPGWSLPSPPRNLTATAGPGYVLLSWKPPVSSGAPQNRSYTVMYNVFRGTSPGQEKFLAQVNGTSYTDFSVEPGKTYYYVVVAVNPAGASEFSNEVSATVLSATPPSAVSNLEVRIVGDYVELSWSPPLNTGGLPVTEYVVYRGLDASQLSVYQTLPGNVTSFQDRKVEPGKTYYYSVQAVNKQGKGDLSGVVTVVAPVRYPWMPLPLASILMIVVLVGLVIFAVGAGVKIVLQIFEALRAPLPREAYVGKTVDVVPGNPTIYVLERPVRIHGYECRARLGKSRISATLLCVDSVGENHVLKIPVEFYDYLVHREPINRPTVYGRFGEEVRVLEEVARLGHPCIVEFEKALESYGDNPPTLVFEYCERGSLKDMVEKNGRLDPATAVKIVVQIADALAVIHELGYAHGDVKPENILFTKDRIPKLADFNSARAIASTGRSIVPYTYGFAAPEHIHTGRPSQKGDVWSLALVLYEAVTGRSLFSPDERYPGELEKFEKTGKPEIQTGDAALDEILRECIRKKPEARPTMRQFEEKLIDYLRRKEKKKLFP